MIQKKVKITVPKNIKASDLLPFAENGECPFWRSEWLVIPNELNHSLCNWSSGIHGGLTVGQGKLDSYGYWEYPCNVCARKYEELYPEEVPIWPFK